MKKSRSNTFKYLVVLTLLATSFYISETYFKENIGFNKHLHRIKLRAKADSSLPPVDYLHKNQYAVINAQARRWVYVDWGGQVLVVSKKAFEVGYYRFYKHFIVESEKYTIGKFSLLGFFIILTVFSIKSKSSSHTENRQEKQQEKQNNQQYPDTRQARPDKNPDVIDRDTKKLQEIQQHFYEQAKQEIARVQKELTATYTSKIDEMEQTISVLKQEFNVAQHIASTFEIDLTDSEIDTLVKGREFELFAAKLWQADAQTKIEEWRSDKGVKQDIFVISHGYPDFVITLKSASEEKQVAVECKYRSAFQPNRKGQDTYVSWASFKNTNNYRKFKNEMNMEVYILLGIGGLALTPEHLYLAKLESITDDKVTFEHVKLKQTWSTTKNKIKPFSVEPDQVVQEIKSRENIY